MSESPVKIDIGVKAELPSDVIRQQSDALQDALSPFVQGLGYLGDKINYYRHLSALRMLKRAKEICLKEGLPLRPPPLKVLIPLVEEASLEEDDSPLSEMWASLLASTATDPKFNSQVQIYRDFLKKMGTAEVLVLDNIGKFFDRARRFYYTSAHRRMRGSRPSLEEFSAAADVSSASVTVDRDYHQIMKFFELWLEDELREKWVRDGDNTSTRLDKFLDDIRKHLSSSVQFLLFAGITSDERISDHARVFSSYDLIDDPARSVLAYLGLIEKKLIIIRPQQVPQKPVTLIWGFDQLTKLGVDFVQRCCRT